MNISMLAVGLVYLGLISAFWGGVSLLKPLDLLAAHTRSQAAVLLGVGLALTVAGWILPAKETRIIESRTLLDEFAPRYHFNEIHTVYIRAPRDQIHRAIKELTAEEILFFRTLTWIRRLGRRGPESILNAPERLPLLEVATRTSFLLLGEVPGREILVGTVVSAPAGARPPARPTPDEFKAMNATGAKAIMNFLIEEDVAGICLVKTETRVCATDVAARRRFAVYWRVIYPGSALIRRMWLRAIRLRAEAAS